MKLLSLSGRWQMRQAGGPWHEAAVPGSVYADLLRDGTIPDPFWRENELAAFDLLKNDFEYRRVFTVPEELLRERRVVLRCLGLDTLAHIELNGVPVGDADNMHVAWGFDVKRLLREGENDISVRFASPVNYCLAEYEKRPMWGASDAIPGIGHLRKAHCMFGWDWGPRLPDAGIWQDIRLEGIDRARLESVLVLQEHADGAVTLRLRPDIDGDAEACEWTAEVTCPDGTVLPFDRDTLRLEHPELWWPRGYGAQPLYTVRVTLTADGREQDVWERRIGLRTLSVHRESDRWGEQFCHICNGVKVFAMGADYIPEDNILSRVTPERTRRLLEDAALANHNTIRVWGGGYYPSDTFYDVCDELGLMVWQDLMYACSLYDLTDAFEASITVETRQQLRRLRSHPSLALVCGNNEDESFVARAEQELCEKGVSTSFAPARRSHIADYIRMYSHVLPRICREEAPQTFWWPSSPSSGGDFDDPGDYDRGDTHYWDVWHGEKPFTEYRKFFFRYASEFGFQSFPCLRTVERFTLPEDRNIFSRVMERHQRNKSANGKILSYVSQTFRYPSGLDDLIFASQLLQAEAIRYGVEHWRRHRGRCMGAIVWQLNDCWPVASWSSIDYYGRWKALHYAEKRCFQPVLVSCEEHGEIDQNPHINELLPAPIVPSARLSVANERREAFAGTVRWALRTPDAKPVLEGEAQVTAGPLSSVWLEPMTFADACVTGHYLSYELSAGDGSPVSSGTALFCAPKHFAFADPHLTVRSDGDVLTVRADAYARMVWIESEDPDLLLEDNGFDLNGGSRTVRVLRGSAARPRVRSVWDIGRETAPGAERENE